MNTLLVFPMFALVVHTAISLVIMFQRRVDSVKAGEIPLNYFKARQGKAEPSEKAVVADRHFSNLFETPVLFYAGCIVAMFLPVRGLEIILIAWAFVITRLIHSWIHLTSNRLKFRMRIYGVNWLTLLALWGMIAWSVATRL
jgi:hypothetical protein